MRRERERKKERKRGDLNHLSVHQWLRSAIRDSIQPISPIGFLFLKLPPPACAVLLVQYGIYIYTYTICRSPIDHLHVISRSYIYIYILVIYHLCIIYVSSISTIYLYFGHLRLSHSLQDCAQRQGGAFITLQIGAGSTAQHTLQWLEEWFPPRAWMGNYTIFNHQE